MNLEDLLYNFSNYKYEEVRETVLSYFSGMGDGIEKQKLVAELEALFQRSRDAQKQSILGLISYQDYSVEKNKHNYSFIALITQIDQVKKHIHSSDIMKWNDALRLDSRSGYEDFIREHPGNTYIRLAQNRLHSLNRMYEDNERDKDLWKKVEDNLTYKGLLKYLSKPYAIAFRTEAENILLSNLAEPKKWNALLFKESVLSLHLRSFEDFIDQTRDIVFSLGFKRELKTLFKKIKHYHEEEIKEQKEFWELDKYYRLYEDEIMRKLIRKQIERGIKEKVPQGKYEYLDELNSEIKGVGVIMFVVLAIMFGVYYKIKIDLPESKNALNLLEWGEIILVFLVLVAFFRRVKKIREDILNNVGTHDLPFPVQYNTDLEIKKTSFLINWGLCTILVFLIIYQIPVYSLLLKAIWHLLSVTLVSAVFLRIVKSQLKYNLEDYFADPELNKGILKKTYGTRWRLKLQFKP